MTPTLRVQNIGKSFVLHLQGGLTLPVIKNASFQVGAGECVVLRGPSGTGKSSLLKMVYGTYPSDGGSILVSSGEAVVDVAKADAHSLRRLRRDTVGYVSQFLRVIPRVAALEIVAEPLICIGVPHTEAHDRAAELLSRLNVPRRLWALPPATFSGGEQQRVNIARGLAHPYSLLLLDEPTASLDADNREAVIAVIEEARSGGAAILGIFHDQRVRDRLADRTIDVDDFAVAA